MRSLPLEPSGVRLSLPTQKTFPVADVLLTLNSLFEGIIVVDLAERITFLNLAAERLCGWSHEEAVGRQGHEVFKVENAMDRQRAWNPLGDAMRTNTFYTLLPSSTLVTRDGLHIPIEDSISPLRDKNGEVVGGVILFRDVSASRLLLTNALHQSQHDQLTCLPNRSLLKDRLQQAVLMLEGKRHSVAMFFIDVDGFKGINDEHGHAVGDLVLQVLAKRLSSCVRQADTVSRFGGDEFVVMLPEVSGAYEAVNVAEKVRRICGGTISVHGNMLQVSLSIGVAVCNEKSRVDTLMEDADSAMYSAKEAGGNRVHLFAAKTAAYARRRLSLEEELYSALVEDRFVLHYQPQIDLNSGVIVGAEGLLRWETAEGLRLPGDFMQVAERSGLIVSIGQLVLRKAIQQQNLWRKDGRADLMLSVNVSPVELESADYLKTLATLLRDENYVRNSLMLEVTESAPLRADQVKVVFEGILEEGLGLCLDDFGMGYSNMTHLRLFPLEAIKIDRSFVTGATTSDQGLALLTAVTSMARSLSKQLVAEGIETQEQLELLQGLGCDLGQGFLYAPAVSAEKFEELLSEGSAGNHR